MTPAALATLRADAADLSGALHLAADAAAHRGDEDMRAAIGLLARFAESIVERFEGLFAVEVASREEAIPAVAPPARAVTRSEVAALLGELTVAAALGARAALAADMTDRDWESLMAACRALADAAPEERQAVCAALDEPTRRRLALTLLQSDFLANVAHAAVERAPRGE